VGSSPTIITVFLFQLSRGADKPLGAGDHTTVPHEDT
jgi:hypothetical protein